MDKRFFNTTFGRIIVITFDVTYDYSDSVQVTENTVTDWDAHQIVDILPSAEASGRAGCSINLNVDYSIQGIGVGSISTIYWAVTTWPLINPSVWNTIDTTNNTGATPVTGITNITIGADEVLHLRIDLQIVNAVARESHATMTLIDGTGAPYTCVDDNIINSLVASGSPLAWTKSLIGS